MRWLVVLLLGVMFAGAVATVADARPGGGGSYSSGSSRSSGGSSYRSSSSGGGGSGGDGFVLGLGLMFAVIVIMIALSPKNESATVQGGIAATPVTSHQLQPLVAVDPAFSQVTFEDFAFQLYARVQRSRGNPARLAELTPYVSNSVLAVLEHSPPVAAVVIGSLRIIRVGSTNTAGLGLATIGKAAEPGAQPQTLEVRIEANLAGNTGTINTIERWTFARNAGVVTRAPDRTRTFPCPNCNAPFARGAGARTCAHCNTDIGPGQFDWTLTEVIVGATTNVGVTLTGTVEEVGNDLVTIVAPDAFPAMQALYEADKNVTWTAFESHVRMIYDQLNTAWNGQNLAPVRGLVTHSLLGYLQFWIDEYKRQNLANKLEDAKLGRVALAKVTRDPYFDAVTVRVVADGHDFTIDGTGSVVGGSKTARRLYTEYWTLIRSSTRRGPITNTPNCPNCGAPLSISDAGACTHCNAEVESGSFDWVLSKIEQDEVYYG